MADAAVVRIPIDDAAFQKFLATFNAYQKDVGNQGKAWAEGSAGLKKFGEAGEATFSSMAEGLASVTAALAAVAMRQGHAETAASRTNTTLRDTLRLTGGILSNVTGVALQLTRWALLGGLTGLATGMLGAGALASGASGLRSQSRYYGVRPGQLQAAQTVFGPMGVNADQLFGSISDFQLQNPAWATMLGIGPNVNPGDALPNVLRSAVNQFRAGGPLAGPAMLQQRFPFLDPGMIRQLSRLPSGELEQAFKDYGQQSRALDIPDLTLKRWQELDSTLQQAEKQIKTALIDGLAPLTPQLRQLSTALAGTISSALGATSEFLNETPERRQEDLLRTPGGNFLDRMTRGFLEELGNVQLDADISRQRFDQRNMLEGAFERKYGRKKNMASIYSGMVPLSGTIPPPTDPNAVQGAFANGTTMQRLYQRGSDPGTWNTRVEINVHNKPGTDVTTQVNQLPQN